MIIQNNKNDTLTGVRLNTELPIIKAESAAAFIRDFNDNKVSGEFLQSCEKAGKLFSKKK